MANFLLFGPLDRSHPGAVTRRYADSTTASRVLPPPGTPSAAAAAADRAIREVEVNIESELRELLDGALSLGGRGLKLTADSKLFGSLPELDSVGVVSVLTALEDRYGIAVEDDEISAETFATLGSFTAFVASKLEG